MRVLFKTRIQFISFLNIRGNQAEIKMSSMNLGEGLACVYFFGHIRKLIRPFIHLSVLNLRGAVATCNGTESRRKVVSSRLGSPWDDWKTLSVNPAVNGYLFRIREE